jgi:4-amino-4-deoxy-L-arabinose transferase-like glycosyltransferase
MISRRWSGPVLVFLTVLALITRVWWLDRAPQGLLIDEAHYGYIAHSLLETGKDEHGMAYPVIFRGFGDQKLPVYGYVLMPFIKWFGLTATAVRLPSAVAGALLVPVMFWLLREFGVSRKSALVGATLVVFSPWTFILSRFAFESNLALLFFTVGLICLLKSVKQTRIVWLVLAAVAWALTWYTYVAYRPVTLVVAVLFFGYAVVRKQLPIKLTSIFFGLFGLLIAPLFHPAIAQTGTARLNQVGIFSSDGVVMEVNENRTYCDMILPKEICYVLWNKGTVVSKELIQRFFHVYSPQFMATEGDAQLRYLAVENFGQLFLLIYPLLVLGLIVIVFQVEGSELTHVARWLLVVGLLITPLPVIFAGEPQKIRLSSLIPFVMTAVVLGWNVLQELLPSPALKRAVTVVCVGLFCFGSVSYLVNFYTIHTVKNDFSYQSYLPGMFERLESLKKPETKIFIKPFFSDPIMAYAFYAEVDPAHYQSNVVLGAQEVSGFQHAIKLDTYQVSDDPLINIGCKAVSEGYPALYVTNEDYREADKAASFASTTGAVHYAYAYDAAAYAASNPTQCH